MMQHKPEIIYITTDDHLQKVLSDCINANPDTLFIDTEFTRRSTYYPDVELIQMLWEQGTVVVLDMQSVHRFEELMMLLQNSSITKVFHSARQDIEGFLGLLNIIPDNIFDTQVAAAFLGFGQSIGLNDLLQNTLDLDVDKNEQFSDWSLRPLRMAQIEYAAQDVYYLALIYHKLLEELQLHQRQDWVSNYFKEYDWYQKLTPKPEHTWVRLKNQISSESSLFFLTYFAPLREQLSQEFNFNRARVLTDKNLIVLCESLANIAATVHSIQSFDDFEFPDPYDPEIIQSFIQLANRTLAGYASRSKKKYKLLFRAPDQVMFSQKQHTMYIHIKNMINAHAQRLVIPANFLASNVMIEDFVLNPSPEHALLQGWRSDIFAQDINKMLDEIKK